MIKYDAFIRYMSNFPPTQFTDCMWFWYFAWSIMNKLFVICSIKSHLHRCDNVCVVFGTRHDVYWTKINDLLFIDKHIIYMSFTMFQKYILDLKITKETNKRPLSKTIRRIFHVVSITTKHWQKNLYIFFYLHMFFIDSHILLKTGKCKSKVLEICGIWQNHRDPISGAFLHNFFSMQGNWFSGWVKIEQEIFFNQWIP